MSDALRRVLVLFAVVAALAGVVYAFTLVDTGDGTEDVVVSESSPVEDLIPDEGAEILRQERIGIDLRPGWTGTLIVNRVEIPEVQLQIDNLDSLGQILYSAGEGKVVERFEAGQNCVTAVIWRVQESRDDAQNVSWCFNVT